MTKREREKVRWVQAMLIAMERGTEGPPAVLQALRACIYELCVAMGHQEEALDYYSAEHEKFRADAARVNSH